MTAQNKFRKLVITTIITLVAAFSICLVSINTSYAETLEEAPYWKAMQVDTREGKINFYPAFNQGDCTVEGYQFAVKKGNVYTEVVSICRALTMSDICNAIVDSTISDSKTLFYHKLDGNSSALKCYTTIDIQWFCAFRVTSGERSGEADAYNDNFVKSYLQDAEGRPNGVTTPVMDPRFGKGWNARRWTKAHPITVIPQVNGVDYVTYDSNSLVVDGGFYGSYGGKHAGLLSKTSHHAWAKYLNKVCATNFSVEDNRFFESFSDHNYCVVLAREFN